MYVQAVSSNNNYSNPFSLSSKLQGIDIGMVSYDGIVYVSLETRVARYCNN